MSACRSIVLGVVALVVMRATVASAQDAAASSTADTSVSDATSTSTEAIPPPPPGADGATPLCGPDLSLHEERCMRHGTHYELGPSIEGIGGGVGLFAVGYLVQVISTAVSTAQGQHDVGLTYSASALADYERWGYVPLLGPWAKLVLAPPHVDGAGATLFVVEGLFQIGGVVALLVSLIVHPVDDWSTDVAGRWRVVPTADGLALRTVF